MLAMEQLNQELSRNLQRLQETPADAELNRQAGYLLGMLQRYEEAMTCYQQVLVSDPQDAAAWYGLGLAACGARAVDVAQQALTRAFELGYDDVRGRGELAKVIRRMGDPITAMQHLKIALELAKDEKQESWIYGIFGHCYGDLGDRERQLQYYEKAIQTCAHNASVHYALGCLHSEEGNYEEALSHLEIVVGRLPENADAWKHLGIAASAVGIFERAREALEKAIALGQDDIETRKELVWVLQSQEDFTAAIDQGMQALELAADPQLQAGLHGILSYCFAAVGDYPTAQSHCQRAVTLNPRQAAVWYNVGLAYRELGNHEEAVNCIQKALTLDPEQDNYWLVLAQVYLDMERRDLAEPILRELLNTDHREGAHLLLVKIAVEQQNTHEALRLAEEEVRQRPHSAVAWAALSYALQTSGDKKRSEEALKRALELDADNPWVNWLIDNTKENVRS
jgi:tetratricopeptide (TPR) repeat protein